MANTWYMGCLLPCDALYRYRWASDLIGKRFVLSNICQGVALRRLRLRLLV
jgi:hypothetical protein